MDKHEAQRVDDQSQKLLFEAVFQYATMGVLITEESGKIILANHFVLRSFGYTSAELLGKPVEYIIPQRFHRHHVDYRKVYTCHAETRAMGAGRDLFGLRKDGSEFPVEVSLSPFKTGNELLVIAFIVDISVRKEKEKAEKEYESALLSLAKEKELNDMKSRFISMASHEFKTPLSTILSSASLLSKYTKAEDQLQRERHIERIKSSVIHLNSTLNEFLDLGQIEHGNIQTHLTNFDLRELIHEVWAEVESLKGKDRDIRLKYEGGEMIGTDRHLLKNILVNLLSNAFKFSPDKAPVEVTCLVGKDETTIKIKDHGVGISPEDGGHIYNLFYRGNNVLHIAGTGLGLAIVSRYAELIHATLTFTSELNKGTEFILILKNEKNTNH
ncbi:MAG TPA: PAS domain-containing sensor histidine kinase [Chitinophagaceae bacterium]|nr:PAS domain-containing sensor histidine kinase [Chitinophagaceae bacterium]